MAKVDPQFFQRRSDLVSTLVTFAHIALVFAPLYAIASYGLSWWIVPAWLYFGFGMNGLLNLLHETAHSLVFRHKKASEWLGRYFLAPLVFADFDGYRNRHWDHHRFLGVEGETKDAYLINIRGKNLFSLAFRCLTCTEALKRFSKQTSCAIPESDTDEETAAIRKDSVTLGLNEASNRGWMYRVIAVQAVVSGSLFFTGLIAGYSFWQAFFQGAVIYGFVFIYGLMSVTIFAAALRAIAEHQNYGESDHKGYAALRNFKCNPITRFLMGAYGFGEHETHHLHPGIPYYKLPELTEVLAQTQPSLHPRHGYFAGLLMAIRGIGANNANSDSMRSSAANEMSANS